MREVVVVGAGLAGLAVALELRVRGAAVTVLEGRYPGAGNSSRNVGRIRRMQLTSALTAYSCAARRKWDRVPELVGGRNPLLYPTDYTLICYSDEELEHLTSLEPMWREHDARATVVGPARTLRLAPILRGGEPVRGAAVCEAGIVHHDAAVYAYLLACRDAGVRVRYPVEATAFDHTGGELSGVLTSTGDIVPCDAAVDAAGGTAGELARKAGIRVPITPVRREVLVTAPSRPFMTPAVTFYRPQEGWFNQTLRGELVAGVVDPLEPSLMTEDASLSFLVRTASMLMRKAPRLGELRVIRQWAGVYEMTPDKGPLVGPYAGLPGAFALNGWSGRGVNLAPLSAELLAEEMLGGERHGLLDPFGADRFDGLDQDAPAAPRDYYSAYGAVPPQESGRP